MTPRKTMEAEMEVIKVEWVREDDLYQTEGSVYRTQPVVRLAAVDQVIEEAVWAMEQVRLLHLYSETHAASGEDYQRAKAFLASVAEWRTREEKR